jgi:hypothetical protein
MELHSNMKTLRSLSLVCLLLCFGGFATAQTPNASSTTPAAPSGGQNCQFQSSGVNFSCYIPSGVYDLSGVATTAVAAERTTAANASNLSSGTLPSGRLPATVPTSVTNTGSGAPTITGNVLNIPPVTGGTTTFSGLSGVATAAQLPAATTSAQGAVVLPAGAGSNTLGTAAAQPTTAFDAAGAATTAITTAETYSSNAGNLTSGTVANSMLAGTGIVTVNTIPCTLGSTCTIATGATPPATGLLAQYLLIDCTFSNGGTCPDTSGNGNNAVIAGSAVTNGSWGAYLNPGNPYAGLGTGQYINLPTADNSGNLFIVNFQTYLGPLNSGTTSASGQWNVHPTIMGSNGFSTNDWAVTGGGSFGYSPSDAYFAPNIVYNGGTSFRDQTLVPHGGFPITMAFYSGAPNRFWINGVEQGYVSQYGSAFPAVSTYLALGGYPGGGNSFNFQGTIGMAMVYNTAVTGTALDGLVKQLNSYVNSIVSPRPGYPIPQSSQTGVTNLLWAGDSISCGLFALGTTVQQYLALNNPYTVINSCLSSVDAHSIAPLFQARNGQYLGLPYSTLTGSGVTPSKCVIWLGTNDMTSGYTAQSTWANLVAIGQQCHQDGAQSVIMTMISRNGFDPQKNALNTVIRQNWKSSGAFDMLADVAEVPLLGADGAYANTTYFTGGVHLFTAGQQLVAPPVSNAINYMDGSSDSAPNVVNTSIGVIPTLIGGVSNYSFILPTPLQAGSISSISFQTNTATTSPITFGLATGSGTSYTIVPGSTFTITPGGTTSLQTFTAGTGFTAPMAATAGEFIAIWASTALPGDGNSTVGYYYFPSTSLPSGAKTYSFDGAHALAVTVTIPSVTYAMSPADKYVQLMSSDTGVTLPPCSGLTGSIFTIFAPSSTTVNNSSDAAAAIAGSTTISANTTAKFIVNLYGGATAGGCNYIRIQ